MKKHNKNGFKRKTTTQSLLTYEQKTYNNVGWNSLMFWRICNSPALSVSICNALIGLQILILTASGFQIPMNKVYFC